MTLTAAKKELLLLCARIYYSYMALKNAEVSDGLSVQLFSWQCYEKFIVSGIFAAYCRCTQPPWFPVFSPGSKMERKRVLTNWMGLVPGEW